MTDETQTTEQPATPPAETASDGDTWESGATERTQKRLEAEAQLETLYPDPDEAEKTAPKSEPEPKPDAKPAEAPKPINAEPGEPLWSNEDLQTFTALQAEAQRLQADMAQLAQLRAADIDQLAGGDKAKAAALRKDLEEWEQNLAARHQALSQQAAVLQEKATERQTARMKANLKNEAEKLNKAFPDLDKKTLRAYLIEQGFTEKEIKSSSDSRVVAMAEKARRYDEMMAKGGPRPTKKIPVKTGATPKDAAPERPDLDDPSPYFRAQARLRTMYPGEQPGRRRAVRSDDPAEILYGKAG